jgi:hypothetical protein
VPLGEQMRALVVGRSKGTWAWSWLVWAHKEMDNGDSSWEVDKGGGV